MVPIRRSNLKCVLASSCCCCCCCCCPWSSSVGGTPPLSVLSPPGPTPPFPLVSYCRLTAVCGERALLQVIRVPFHPTSLSSVPLPWSTARPPWAEAASRFAVTNSYDGTARWCRVLAHKSTLKIIRLMAARSCTRTRVTTEEFPSRSADQLTR